MNEHTEVPVKINLLKMLHVKKFIPNETLRHVLVDFYIELKEWRSICN